MKVSVAAPSMKRPHEPWKESEELGLDELGGISGGIMPPGFVSDPRFRRDIKRLVKECDQSGIRGKLKE